MQKAKAKGILCFLLTLLMFAGVFAGVFTPRKYALAAEDFRMWRQLDDRWGNTAMGGTTVRRSGCYITSIAMVAVASGARDTDSFDPGVFAKQLNDMGAFSSGGALIAWASVNKAIPEISIATANISFKSGDQKGKAAEMKEYLDKGMYVICNVGGHWVYVDGIIGDDVYMADPAKDDILMFEAYNNAGINCYQALKGKNPYSGFTPLKTNTAEVATSASSSTATTATTVTAASTTKAAVSTVKTSAATSTSVAKTTVTSAKTTVAASTSKAAPKEYKTGEYYCTSDEKIDIYADIKDTKSVIAALEYGNVVNIISVNGSYGEVSIDGKKGWISLDKLEYADSDKKLSAGDINGDGSADAYDLALLNEYIISREKLPEGISVLTSQEIKAADLSGDEIINNTDVLLYLMLICN
ncbi:dockerin type I repeat-containing protein [Ruminococcus flavefaciens]|uniref:dockerin type I repeat-containing protein n=1 Tax=Ruminococcus flavefaciens TaxID=1265 RepID=UPI0004909022|nr:dockerin type I repeat-containing protein [Ruminococcus flavefaciens]